MRAIDCLNFRSSPESVITRSILIPAIEDTMNSTRQRTPREWRISRKRALVVRDPERMLDALLALDRMVVEVSMQLYNINLSERSMMRRQNRRLHAAVRKHLPKLLRASRSKS